MPILKQFHMSAEHYSPSDLHLNTLYHLTFRNVYPRAQRGLLKSSWQSCLQLLTVQRWWWWSWLWWGSRISWRHLTCLWRSPSSPRHSPQGTDWSLAHCSPEGGSRKWQVWYFDTRGCYSLTEQRNWDTGSNREDGVVRQKSLKVPESINRRAVPLKHT